MPEEVKLEPDTKHEQYAELIPDVLMCRDLDAGPKAVKKGPRVTTYIPMEGGHAADPEGKKRYAAYVERAYFFGAFGRTVDALSGLVNRREPVVSDAPADFKEFLDDVDGQGTKFSGFCASLVKELVKVGRVGLLTDYPVSDGAKLSKAEREALSRRPYLTLFKAEDVINWRTKRVGARSKLSLVVLDERVSTSDPKDPLGLKEICVQQIRILDLDMAAGGAYRMRTFQLLTAGKDQPARWVLGPTVYPTASSASGDPVLIFEIQFDFINAEDCLPGMKRPPMTDLAEAVIAYLRNSADYENALHKLGYPQLYFSGYDPEKEEGYEEGDQTKKGRQKKVWSLGVGVWTYKGEVKPAYLSLDSSLDPLQQAMTSKREDMVALGARMLARDKLAAEAAKTEELRRQPENSALATIAVTASEGLTRVLKRAAAWLQLDASKISVRVNQEFFESTMNAADVAAWIAAVQEGAFAMSDLRHLMRQGGAIRPERTDDEIDKEIAADGEAMSGFTADPNVDPTVDPSSPGDPTQGDPTQSDPLPKKKAA